MTVWKREVEAPEVRDQGYLRLLQTRSPGETFRGEQSAFKAQGEENAGSKCLSLEFGGQSGWVMLASARSRTVGWRRGLCPAQQFLPLLSPSVSTLLTLLPPPVLKCRQFTVAGKHLTVLKGEQIGGSGLG